MTDRAKKISELSSLATVTGDDLLVIVDDPSGTATTKKVTATVLKNFVSPAFANTTVAGIIKVGENLTANATGFLNASAGVANLALNTGTVNALSYTAGVAGSSYFLANSSYLAFGNTSANIVVRPSLLTISNVVITPASLIIDSLLSVTKISESNRQMKFFTANASGFMAETSTSGLALRTGVDGLPAAFTIHNHISDFSAQATSVSQTQTYLDPVGVFGWNLNGYGSSGVIQEGIPGLGLVFEYDYYATSLGSQVSETYFSFQTEALPFASGANTAVNFRSIEFQNSMERERSFSITNITSSGSNTIITVNTSGVPSTYGGTLTLGETLHISGLVSGYTTLNNKKLRLIDISGTFGSSVVLTCDFTSSGTYSSAGTVTFYPQGRGTNMGFHSPFFYWYTGDFNNNYLARKRDNSGDLSSNERKLAQLYRGGLTLYQTEKLFPVNLDIGDQNQDGDPFATSTYVNFLYSQLKLGPNNSRSVALRCDSVGTDGTTAILDINSSAAITINKGRYGTPSSPVLGIPGSGYDGAYGLYADNSKLPSVHIHGGSLPNDNSVFWVSPGTTRTPTASTAGAEKFVVRFDARTAVWNGSSPTLGHSTYLTNEGWWFVGNCNSLPAINPVNGGYLYVDGADKKLKFRGINGFVTTLTPTV